MIDEAKITEHCTVFKVDGIQFFANFVPPAKTLGLVKHENEWLLTQSTYHSHRQGRPVASPRQRPRNKTIGHFPTLEACREHLADLATQLERRQLCSEAPGQQRSR